jgi:hypothetical protein
VTLVSYLTVFKVKLDSFKTGSSRGSNPVFLSLKSGMKKIAAQVLTAVLIVFSWGGIDATLAQMLTQDRGVANGADFNKETDQGRGVAVKSSKTRMHLGLDTAAGIDTNPFSIPSASMGDEFVGDAVLRLRPALTMANADAQILWDTGFSFDWGMMPGVFQEGTSSPLLYHADAHAAAEFSRGSAMSFALRDSVAWYTDPGQAALGALQSRINNNLLAGLAFKPGGGALMLRTDYSFAFEKYVTPIGQEPSPTSLANGVQDSLRHLVHARADWRFLPRTGAFVDVRGGMNSYPFGDVNPTSYPLWLKTGVMGQFSRKLSGVLSAGYGNPFIMDTPAGGGEETLVTAAFPGIIGHVELRWFPNMSTQIAGGIKRDVNPAAVYQYVASSAAYFQLEQKIGRKMRLTADLSAGMIEFGEEQYSTPFSFTTKPTGRVDTTASLHLEAGYSVTEWLSIGILERFNARFTDASQVDTTSGAVLGNLSLNRNELFLIGSVHY